MYTIPFPAPADREHRLVCQEKPAPAPAAPAAPPEAKPEAKRSPEGKEGGKEAEGTAPPPVESAKDAAAQGIAAAKEADAELWRHADRIANLRSILTPHGGYDAGHGLDWKSVSSRDLQVARNLLTGIVREINRDIDGAGWQHRRHGPARRNVIEARHAGEKADIQRELDTINATIDERATATSQGISVAELHRRQEVERLARTRPPAAPSGPEALAGSSPAPTPELRLARAEKALSEPRATNVEKAGATLDLLEATSNAIAQMDPQGSDKIGSVPAVSRQRMEQLVQQRLDAPGGMTIDAFVARKEAQYQGEEGTLADRLQDATRDQATAEGELTRLGNELADAKKTSKPADVVTRLEQGMAQKTQEKATLDDAVVHLSHELQKAQQEHTSDIAALKSMQAHAKAIVRTARGEVQRIAAKLSGSTAPENRALGALLSKATLQDDGGLGIYVSATDVETLGALNAKFPTEMKSAPRFLAKLKDIAEKDRATA